MDKVRCYFLVVLNDGYTLHFTYIWDFLFSYILFDLDNNDSGYCQDVCCDEQTEETCYGYDYVLDTSYNTCALIADGGCACPGNQVKCGQGKIFFIVANEIIYLFISLIFESFISPTHYQTLKMVFLESV